MESSLISSLNLIERNFNFHLMRKMRRTEKKGERNIGRNGNREGKNPRIHEEFWNLRKKDKKDKNEISSKLCSIREQESRRCLIFKSEIQNQNLPSWDNSALQCVFAFLLSWNKTNSVTVWFSPPPLYLTHAPI